MSSDAKVPSDKMKKMVGIAKRREDGESLESFASRVLAPEGISLDEFKNSSEYNPADWEMSNEDEKMKGKEATSSSSTKGESGPDGATSSTMPKPPPTDPDTAIPGEAPKSKSLSELNVGKDPASNANVPGNPEGLGHKLVDGGPMELDLRKSFDSALAIHYDKNLAAGDRLTFFYYLDLASKGLTIAPFKNVAEFKLEKILLICRIVSHYGGVLHGLPSQNLLLNVQTRLTAESAMGYPATSVNDKWSDADHTAYIAAMQNLSRLSNRTDPSPLNKAVRHMMLCGHPDEIALKKALSDIEKRRIVSFHELREFYNSIQSQDTILSELPDHVRANDPYYYAVFSSAGFDPYLSMMRESLEVRRMVFESVEQRVRNLISSGVKDGDIQVSRLHQMFSNHVFIHDEMNSVPVTVIGNANPNAVSNMLTVAMMTRYASLKAEVPDFSTLKFTRIVDCILVRLMFPAHFFDEQSLINYDNYLVFVLAHVNGGRTNNHINLLRIKYSADACAAASQQGVSLLADFFDPANFTSAKTLANITSMKPFLLGNRNGYSGWSTGGVTRFSGNVKHGKRFLGRDYASFNLTGADLHYPGHLSPQMENFKAFATAFSSILLGFPKAQSKMATSVQTFLSVTMNSLTSIAEGYHSLQKMSDTLGMNPLARPDGPGFIEANRLEIPIPTGAITALAVTTDWSSLAVTTIPHELINAGHRTLNFFAHFADVRAIIHRSTANLAWVTEKVKLEYMFKCMDALKLQISFAEPLKKIMIDRSETFPFPGSAPTARILFDSFSKAQAFLDKHELDAGFASKVAYVRAYSKREKGPFSVCFEPDLDPQHVLGQPITDADLIIRSATSTLTTLTAQANSENKNIIFDIPMRFQREVTTDPIPEQTRPFGDSGESLCDKEPIKVYLTFRESAHRSTASKFAFTVSEPRFLPVSQSSFYILEDITYPLRLCTSVPTMKEEFQPLMKFDRRFVAPGFTPLNI
jgi:hypothetical protein